MSGVLNTDQLLSAGLLYIKNQKNFNILTLKIVFASHICAGFDNPIGSQVKKFLSKNLLPVDLSLQNSTTEVMPKLCNLLFQEQQMALLLGAIFQQPQKSFHYSSQENEYLWHSNKEKLIKKNALKILPISKCNMVKIQIRGRS